MEQEFSLEKDLKEYSEKIAEVSVYFERKRILQEIFTIPSLTAKEKEKILAIIFIA